MNTDKLFMARAIELARRGEGRTSPNPLVGAVIVKNGRVIGEGCHKRCGTSHAEIHALRMAGSRASGATLYVTLEPCDHFGRTPPCTDAIIAAGIKRVVIGMLDPNPITNGRGVRKLKRHGIQVRIGILKESAEAINKPFIKFIKTGMPFVRIKVAQSIDGKIATRTGDSRWITGEDARRYVHQLRGMVDAVMVGSGTALKDDPSLLSRLPGVRQPIRIIVDTALVLSPAAKVFSTAPKHSVIVATTRKASFRKAYAFTRRGIGVLFCRLKGGRVDLKDLMKKLASMNITDIMVEGGGELAWGLIREELADHLLFFIAPKIIGGRAAKTSVEGDGIGMIKDAVALKNISIRRFKTDILIEAEAV